MISHLIERVESASGPDRELDIAIMRALVPAEQEKNYWFWQGSRPKGSPRKDPQTYWDKRSTPALSASLDAVVAIIEAKLPEHFWSMFPITDEQIEAHPDAQEHHTYGASLFRYLHVADRQDASGFGATPALALLASFLRAWKEQNNER